jgi:spermidine/putrescine transport system ATP-binding protein
MSDPIRIAGDAALRLVSLSKRFGDVVAVDGIDLTIPAGSFFALLGPSGCGKTTTLRMIAGLEEPTSGQILIGDVDLAGQKPYRRPVNTVFQNYALFPHLDVYQNVAFGLRRRGIRDVAAQVEQMLAMVELTGYGKRRPSQLSGGQQQRVAVARALINQPSVLLLDEPLGALDLKLRRQMQLELKRIQSEVGTTFVHVTHDQEEAMTMADTVAVMNDGRIEQLGSPVELYEHPKTTFAANFLGQSNLIDGAVESTDGDLAIVAVPGGRLAVPLDRMPGTSQVHVGVRPEKLTLTPADQAESIPSHHNRLSAVVVETRFLGVSTEYIVRILSGQRLAIFVQNAGQPDQLAPGADVSVSWDPAHTFALDVRQAADAGLDHAGVPA